MLGEGALGGGKEDRTGQVPPGGLDPGLSAELAVYLQVQSLTSWSCHGDRGCLGDRYLWRTGSDWPRWRGGPAVSTWPHQRSAVSTLPTCFPPVRFYLLDAAEHAGTAGVQLGLCRPSWLLPGWSLMFRRFLPYRLSPASSLPRNLCGRLGCLLCMVTGVSSPGRPGCPLHWTPSP